jgi:hypothetical protein
MNQKIEDDIPFEAIFIASFWILLSVLVFYFISFIQSYYWITLLLTFIGTGFIFIGWGVLIFNKYAFYASAILCVLCLSPNILILPSMFYLIISRSFGYSHFLVTLLLLSFIPVLVLQIKIRTYYINK